MFRKLPCSSQDTAFFRFCAWTTYGQSANMEMSEEGTFPTIKKKKETHEEMPRVGFFVCLFWGCCFFFVGFFCTMLNLIALI